MLFLLHSAHEIVNDGFEGGKAARPCSGDEAPDVTGQNDLNKYVQAHLLLAVSDHLLDCTSWDGQVLQAPLFFYSLVSELAAILEGHGVEDVNIVLRIL